MLLKVSYALAQREIIAMLRYIKYVLPDGPLAPTRLNKAKVNNIAKKEKQIRRRTIKITIFAA